LQQQSELARHTKGAHCYKVVVNSAKPWQGQPVWGEDRRSKRNALDFQLQKKVGGV